MVFVVLESVVIVVVVGFGCVIYFLNVVICVEGVVVFGVDDQYFDVVVCCLSVQSVFDGKVYFVRQGVQCFGVVECDMVCLVDFVDVDVSYVYFVIIWCEMMSCMILLVFFRI